MQRIPLLLSCLLISANILGQNKAESDRLFRVAMPLFESGDYQGASYYFDQAVETDSLNTKANLYAAISFLNYSGAQALSYLERAFRQDSTLRMDFHYLIGLSLQKGYRFREAITHYEVYIAKGANNKIDNFPGAFETEKRISECLSGINFANNPRPIQIINLGPTINSEYPDYGPVLDYAGSVLLFTSKRQEGNLNPTLEEGSYYEDVFYSIWEDSSWTEAINVGKPVNTIYHESVICLAPQGDRLFLYKDEGEGDVYVSSLNNNGWTEPISMRIINTSFSERSLTISPEEDTIIFSSNRDGGMGGFDLYITKFDGKYWTRPENLGPQINTIYDEDSPALTKGGLYFSSKGWTSMGGYDIFYSELDGNDPLNLGYPVNTPEDDIFFVPTNQEGTAYFASKRTEGFGELDIYQLKSLNGTIVPKEFRQREETKVIVDYSNLELKTLFFEFGTTNLLDESEKILIDNIELLEKNDLVKVLLVGHTDNVGSENENAILAMERAMKVALILKENGISETRVRLEAKGECCPIVSNDDPEKIHLNRRVEFIIERD